MKVKVISLKQPWAYLVAAGHKKIEFRSRSSSFRGECYIHASSKIDRKALNLLKARMPRAFLEGIRVNDLPDPGMLITGKIIGKMKVVDCLEITAARDKYPDDIWLSTFGESLGKRAFIIESPVFFPTQDHIPCKGQVFPLFYDLEIVYA